MNEHDELLAARSTAYVLGEMTAEQRQAFEVELQASAELQAEVEEMRAMSELLKGELGRGDIKLPDSYRKVIEDAAAKQSAANTAENNAGSKGELVALPVKPARTRRWGAWALLAATLGALATGGAFMTTFRASSPGTVGYADNKEHPAASPPLSPQKGGQKGG